MSCYQPTSPQAFFGIHFCSLDFEFAQEESISFLHSLLVKRHMMNSWKLSSILSCHGLLENCSTAFVFTMSFSEERVAQDCSPEIPLKSIQVCLSHVSSKFASALADAGEKRGEGKAKDDTPRLTVVRSFDVDVSLEGNLILSRQLDEPGIIGEILGKKNINISFMSVSKFCTAALPSRIYTPFDFPSQASSVAFTYLDFVSSPNLFSKVKKLRSPT